MLNGKPSSAVSGSTINALLGEKNINPDHVVVEVNREIIPKEQFATSTVNENDVVEILRFVGGG